MMRFLILCCVIGAVPAAAGEPQISLNIHSNAGSYSDPAEEARTGHLE